MTAFQCNSKLTYTEHKRDGAKIATPALPVSKPQPVMGVEQRVRNRNLQN